jgi:uncharacterized protein YciI
MALFARTILITVPADQAEEAARRHREQLLDLRAQGKLRLAGEFKNGEGFLEILDVADLLEAEQLARSSPLVEDGLAAWMLREWTELE